MNTPFNKIYSDLLIEREQLTAKLNAVIGAINAFDLLREQSAASELQTANKAESSSQTLDFFSHRTADRM